MEYINFRTLSCRKENIIHVINSNKYIVIYQAGWFRVRSVLNTHAPSNVRK